MADARHIRDQLNQSGKKIYDQLVDQRDRIAKVNPEFANKLYGPHSDLTANEGMVLMAQELAESGITDIYKVKKENVADKFPIKYGNYPTYESGESSQYETGYYYNDPKTGEPITVNPNNIKDFKSSELVWDPNLQVSLDGEGTVGYGGYRQTDPSGYVEVPRTQYVNTETGKPLVVDQYGQYEGKENILQSRGAADRVKIGYGLDFIDDVPTYFQTAYKEPSSWKRATNSFYSNPLLGVAASLIGGPIAGALVSGAKAAYGPGDFGDALKAAALSYGTSMALQNLLPSTSGFDITDVVPADAWYTAPAGFVDELFTGNVGGGTAPTFDPSLAQSTLVDELVAGNSDIPAGTTGIEKIIAESPVIPSDYKYVDDVFSGSGAPTPDVASPDLFNATRFDPFLGIEDLPSGPAAPELDPTLGDPTAAPGGMPKTPPMTPAEAKAALMAGGTGDPYIASEMLGSPPSSWDPSFLATAGAGIKALLSNPVGQFIAGKAIQNLLGGGPQGIQMPGGTPSGAGTGIAQPSVQYAQVPEFDVTKAFSPTLYAMRQQKQG